MFACSGGCLSKRTLCSVLCLYLVRCCGSPAVKREKHTQHQKPPPHLTFDTRSLQSVVHDLAPAYGVDVRRLAVHPLVILVLPPVKVDAQQAAHDARHRGHADESRLHEVHRLDLHAGAEPVLGYLLPDTQQQASNAEFTGVKQKMKQVSRADPEGATLKA